MTPASPSQRRDESFRRFARLSEAGGAPDVAAFLETVDGDIRDDVAEMIAELSSVERRGSDVRPELIPGLVIDGFELVEHVGTGGAGNVWRAIQPSLNRSVALKFLRPELVAAPIAVERFRREAQAAGRLAHTGIVHVFGDGMWQGLPYIVLEFVEGQGTLADWIETYRGVGTLSEGHYVRLAELFRKIAEGLVHAHGRGVVHRDIKPANILIDADMEPKVADFGTALIEELLHLTRTGDFFGTPFYMSPEQAASKRMGIDHRTDVFSLGATLYEALSLTRAFDGDTSVQVFTKILTVDPPDPRTLRSQVPRDLAVICLKSLEKNPEDRYADMTMFRDDLHAFIEGRNIQARPPSVVQRVSRKARRHPRWSTAAAVTAVLAIPLALAWQGRTEAVAATRDAEQLSAGLTLRLAAGGASKSLKEQMDDLWPLSLERVADMEAWVQVAGNVESARSLLHGDIDGLQGQGGVKGVLGDSSRNEVFRAALVNWLGTRNASLNDEIIRGELFRTKSVVDSLSLPDGEYRVGLSGTVGPGIDRRLELIRSAQRFSLGSPDAVLAWAAAASAVAEDPRFDGFELEPIFGLVPLGVDPGSGLQEFAAATTGEVPVRSTDTGHLSMTPESGLVFVLIPGGEHWIGAQASDPDGARYDMKFAAESDLTRVRVTLDPFLISKYEMHQTAFMRLAGFDPSMRQYHDERPTSVENVSHDLAVKYLARAELGLPTQAQWEIAARGGTDARWFFEADDQAADLCNVAGLEAKAANVSWRELGNDWRPVDDGHLRVAPVDSLRPNPYGLHHVHGNVNEVCADTYINPNDPARAPRVGDGLIEPASVDADRGSHVLKGGAFYASVHECRIAHVQRNRSDNADNGNGVRPVHPIPFLQRR